MKNIKPQLMKRKAILPVLLMSLFYFITLSAWAQPTPGGDPDAPKGELCKGGSTSFTSSVSGTSYQWQVNTGNGFENITDNDNYSGANTKVLNLTNVPSSWYGYQYRNVVDGNYSDTLRLTFVNNWTGSKGTAWENGGNWSCGSPPDANTDVVIYAGSVILSSNASCRSIRVSTGASLTVSAGYTLITTK